MPDSKRSAITLEEVGAIAPDLEKITRDMIVNGLWTRPGLSPRGRSLVTLSAFIASNQALGAAALAASLCAPALAAPAQAPLVRIAELEIDPAQVAAYQAAVKEEIDASVRVEPGVLSIYAVAEKDHPNRFHFFEIYADDSAYRKHIDSPHFRKYAETVKSMIRSKKLIDTVPVRLGAKESK